MTALLAMAPMRNATGATIGSVLASSSSASPVTLLSSTGALASLGSDAAAAVAAPARTPAAAPAAAYSAATPASVTPREGACASTAPAGASAPV